MADSTATVATSGTSKFAALAVPAVAPLVHSTLRIGAGLLFMQHGAQKLFGMFGGSGGSGGPVELLSRYGVAGGLEFIGGALIVLGLFTRPVAAVLTLLMISAYFLAHVPQGGFPIQNGGELALLFALVFTYLAGSGAGRGSIDHLRTRAR